MAAIRPTKKMPNLYYSLCGLSRSAEPPAIGRKAKKIELDSKKKNHSKNTILSKSNSFMFFDKPKSTQTIDDEDDSDNEIILATVDSPRSATPLASFKKPTDSEIKRRVMFDLGSTKESTSTDYLVNAQNIDFTNTIIKKDKPVQRKPICDAPAELVESLKKKKEQVSKEESVFPVFTESTTGKQKRKYEMVNSLWPDTQTPMVSLSQSELANNQFTSFDLDYESDEDDRRKRKKELKFDIYKPQQKSFFQSLFSL